MTDTDWVRWFEDVDAGDGDTVGGKNASLGEMISNLAAEGIRVPIGFATTAQAYRELLSANDLDQVIADRIGELHDGADLADVGAALRMAFIEAEIPGGIAAAVTGAYDDLAGRLDRAEPAVAVRSSATAEDLPEASFAGQQDSFLNVVGHEALLDACRRCYASLFTDRAIGYREDRGFDHLDVALSIGVQEMVRSDVGGAGVMFTIDTDSGFPRMVLIDAAWGLGESVVSGTVDPDEYMVFKPLLDRDDVRPVVSRRLGAKATKIVLGEPGEGDPTVTVDASEDEQRGFVLDDDEVVQLARWAVVIEDHYGRPMDIEWAKDGERDELTIVQARPETVHSDGAGSTLHTYRLEDDGERLVSGLAIGDAIATGEVCNLASAAEIGDFVDGAVLVTTATDPDWEPVMRRASAIVTDRGGRTSHAAIVSRELGVAAVIGTGDATSVLDDRREITVSCAESDEGHVYDGVLEFTEEAVDLDDLTETRTSVMLNVADPAASFRWWRLPAGGVGLARTEFVVANDIGVHPMALLHPDRLDDETRAKIYERVVDCENGPDFFVERLANGVGRIAATWWPRPVVVRLSDFKTNEYAGLLGGEPFEPDEENPMLGWRGASRYHDDRYREGFGLECRAVRRVRDEMGLTNTVVMIPFCRTPEEADAVLTTMADHGLLRGRNGLEVYVMAEVPSNIVLADEFAQRFDGFSIGSNDLTQLVLGVDRDSERLASLFDERDPAVIESIRRLVEVAHRHRRPVGFCGQRPSDDPEYAALLVELGVDSISVSPDSFLAVARNVASAEG